MNPFHFRKNLIRFFLSFSLASCSIISPKNNQQPINVPSQWAFVESEKLTQDNHFSYLAWWKKLDDNTLNQLIVEGLKNNNNIGEAQGNLEQAKGQLKAVELSWIPNISTFAGYSNNPELGAPLGFYGVWPEYALFNIFNTIAIQKSAELNVAAQKKAVEATKLILIGQIANSYYTYIAQVAQLKLYTQYQKDLHEMLEIQQADYTIGIHSDIETKTIAQQVNHAIIQQKMIENNTIKSQNALHYLINQNPGRLVTQTNFEQVNTHYPNVALLPVAVLANRPDVAMAELEYRLAIQNKGGGYTQLLPAVQLDHFQGMSNVGESPSRGTTATMNDAYLEWIVNPSVFGQIDALKGAEKAAYYHYIDTVRKALRDVDNNLVNHAYANQMYEAAYKAYNDAEQKYRLTIDLYKTGIVPYRTALQEKLNVDQAAIDVNQMKLMQMVTLVNLYQDLGGGYKVH